MTRHGQAQHLQLQKLRSSRGTGAVGTGRDRQEKHVPLRPLLLHGGCGCALGAGSCTSSRDPQLLQHCTQSPCPLTSTASHGSIRDVPGPWASTAHAEMMPRAQERCWETPAPLRPLPLTSCIILGLLLSQRATPCPQGAPAARAPHPTHPPGHNSLSRKQQLSTLLYIKKKKKAWIPAWTTEIETRSDSGTVPRQPQCSLEPSAMAVPRCCQLSLSSCARSEWLDAAARRFVAENV